MQNPPEAVPINSYGYEPPKTNNGARFSSNPPPRDYVLWSLFNLFYMNACCLGFGALYFSIQARDRKVVGDVEGAQGYGLKARRLNIAALCLSLLAFLIIIIILASSAHVAKEAFANLMQDGD
ncbi:dispanin subfamily A member 2b-like [Conger conger]|uniref:dispanin subfamily A member 2b-like n=1 Tax=Conger conger TaxID=82655 RepID=UPI002A5ACA33|nr:dispanin subfamily A member 2b-like [Conger conger]